MALPRPHQTTFVSGSVSRRLIIIILNELAVHAVIDPGALTASPHYC